jgi:hypothetical protein
MAAMSKKRRKRFRRTAEVLVKILNFFLRRKG